MSAFLDTIDVTKPMGMARYVRRQWHTQLGLYPMMLLLEDGSTLCPNCVESAWRGISDDFRNDPHRHSARPAAIISGCECDESVYCTDCGDETIAVEDDE